MAATKPGAELRRLLNARSTTVSDLAKQLNISGTTVWNWTNKGVPAKHRAGMRALFTDAEIDTFISRPKKPGPKKNDDRTMKEKIEQRTKAREQADRYTLAMNIVKSVLENSVNGQLTKSHLQAIKAVMEAIS